MKKELRIYFFSNYDNEIHNIGDIDHIISDDGLSAEVGKWTKDDGLRVDDNVCLYTLEEILDKKLYD